MTIEFSMLDNFPGWEFKILNVMLDGYGDEEAGFGEGGATSGNSHLALAVFRCFSCPGTS
jgi:hypothetical protein